MHVYMYACMYACMHVCMYVSKCIKPHTTNNINMFRVVGVYKSSVFSQKINDLFKFTSVSVLTLARSNYWTGVRIIHF